MIAVTVGNCFLLTTSFSHINFMVFSRFSTIRKKSDHRTFASPSPMTHLHPYCPLLPHSPAALIRVDTCDARSHAFCGTHTATAQHLRGRRWLHISSTAHCSLFTAHWTYTFSAKEKDVETGLSYFGSRYYSSDLSIWLSVDPMSAKYPSLSPYTYCANNPVRCVDPNGEDPIYAKNIWGKVKKIGDDGQCGSGSYLVRSNTARAVKAATKAGEFYTGDLSASDEVFHIPTGQKQKDVQTTVQNSLASGNSPNTRVEYGGHSI